MIDVEELTFFKIQIVRPVVNINSVSIQIIMHETVIDQYIVPIICNICIEIMYVHYASYPNIYCTYII